MQRDKELRKVPEGYLDSIAVTLDINEDWKRVMALIPKDLSAKSDRFIPKYNCEHVRLIEEHARITKLRCAKILFDEWGTSGRVRPTVQTLMDILQQAQILRAAEELAAMLREDLPPRPTTGPAAVVDLDVSKLLKNASGQFTPGTGNGTTNGTAGNYPTKPISDSNQENFPDFEALGHLSTAQIQNSRNVSNSHQTPTNNTSTREYYPDFSKLIPISASVDNVTNSTMSATSTSNSETSESASEYNTNNFQSDHSAYSHFQIPPSNMIVRVDSEILEDKTLIDFKYSELESITRNFSDSHIGSGGFGDVFVGTHEKYGKLAIKRAHVMLMNIPSLDLVKIFNTEVKSLTILRHENIVPILGYSLDGLAPCIVCEYIEGGSLLENIAEKVLDKSQRMNIICGTAEGLKYIHNTVKPISMTSSSLSAAQTSRKAYFLHGDVKSANILITKSFVPKLCDFGLSRECITTNQHTESIMGTRAYMAPERFSGTITQKGDVFSFGIVILEILTGLPPIVEDNNENFNIKEYVEENCIGNSISNLIDPHIEDWVEAEKIYDVAQQCMITHKKHRPSINVICDMLHEICVSAQ